MEKKIIIANEDLGKHLKELKEMGYNYIVKGQDKFLSGWGNSVSKKHIQLIACKTYEELEIIRKDLENDNTFNYINWWFISDKTAIYNATRNKTYTIRNDWTRCF